MSKHFGKGRKPPKARNIRRILILCEDEKSSVDYFKSFPCDEEDVQIECVGTGYNTDSLMQKAVDRKKSASEPYAEIWVVFDRDSFPDANWNRAFDLARGNNIEACWSNECFELWYLLHFEYRNTRIDRDELLKVVDKHLPGGYAKNDASVYGKLLEKLPVALKNARRLEQQNGVGKGSHNLNPSTKVHELVESLCKRSNKLKPLVD